MQNNDIIYRMSTVKERTIGVIQRDRLSDLLKLSFEKKSGCFYFALLMSWNQIFPQIIVNSEVVNDIVARKDGLGVSPKNVIRELKLREEQLNLRLTRVGVTNFSKEDLKDFREYANIPLEVQVEREEYPVEIFNSNESAIILWMGYGNNGQVGIHYTSYHADDNDRFSPEETITKGAGYLPFVYFYLEPTI